MKKNILVIAAITSASFAILNLSNASPSLGKTPGSNVAGEKWSQISQDSSSQGSENNDSQGYTGTNEDGEQEEVKTK